MAYIEIPMGNQKVGVEVPDFAMELTQQEIVKLNNMQVNALNAISTRLRASIDQDKINYDQDRIGNARISDDIRRNTSAIKEDRDRRRAVENLKNQGFSSITKGLADETFTLSQIFSSFTQVISNINKIFPGVFGKLTTGFATFAGFLGGTYIGILEKFGAGLQKLSRVGVGFGESLVSLRQAAGQASLTLDQFGKVVATNGRAIRALGENTGEGALRFGQLSAALQRQTAQFGYFGLSIGDLNQLLAEEIDARRVTIGTERLRTVNEQQLVQAIQENVTNQMALARVTGQDYQQRLAAQQEVRRNSIAQAYLRGSTDETRKRLEGLASALNESALGSLGPTLQNAIINSLATGMNPAAFEQELFAYLGTAGQTFYRQISTLMRDPTITLEDFNTRVSGLVNELGNEADTLAGGRQNLINMAVFGQSQAAMMLLDAKSAVEDLSFAASSVSDTMASLNSGANRIAGLATDMERFSAQFTTMLTNLALTTFGAITGGEITSQNPAETVQSSINSVTELLARYNTEIASGQINWASEFGNFVGNEIRDAGRQIIEFLRTSSVNVSVSNSGSPANQSAPAAGASDGTQGSPN